MLEHITSHDSKLKSFVQYIAAEFLVCGVQSGLIKMNELERAEELLNTRIKKVEYLSQDEAEKTHGVADHSAEKLEISPDILKALNTASSFSSEGLENARAVLFHELTHFLQPIPSVVTKPSDSALPSNDLVSGYKRGDYMGEAFVSGYNFEFSVDGEKYFGGGSGANEAAASFADQHLMLAYYKNIKGFKQAAMVEDEYTFRDYAQMPKQGKSRTLLEKVFAASGIGSSGKNGAESPVFVDTRETTLHATDDPLTRIVDNNGGPGKQLGLKGYNAEYVRELGRGQSGSNHRVRAITEKMLKATGISPIEFARGSLVFGEAEKKSVYTKYRSATGEDFKNFLEDLDYLYSSTGRMMQLGESGEYEILRRKIGSKATAIRNSLNAKFDNLSERGREK